jgi:hypothetical protein
MSSRQAFGRDLVFEIPNILRLRSEAFRDDNLASSIAVRSFLLTAKSPELCQDQSPDTKKCSMSPRHVLGRDLVFEIPNILRLRSGAFRDDNVA